MADNDSTNHVDINDQQIQALFNNDTITPPNDQQKRLRKRVSFNMAQRDTTLFAFVRLWTALAELLAPIFATIAAKRNITKLTQKKHSSPDKT